jgi:hypothetical protein
MIQITFNPDGTAEHLGDQGSAAAGLLTGSAGAGRTRRASNIEPANVWLRAAFHAVRAAVGDKCTLAAWTRTWACLWRVRVVGGPVLPGCYRDRSEAIRAEVRWLEEHRL